MTAIVFPQSAKSQSGPHRGVALTVGIVLSAWLLLVLGLGAAGGFVNPPGTPPLPIGIGVAAPLVLFWLWMRASPSFREFIYSLDMRFMVGIQAWRWAGLGFLSLYAYHVLPAIFALPAGLGDMTVGLVAPWMILALVRDPGFARSSAFIRWNLFGIFDLVLAVTLGTLSSFLASGTAGEISTAPMASLPLLLIPAFLVPIFLMLHITALLQARRLIRNTDHGDVLCR